MSHGGYGMPSRTCPRCRSNFNGFVQYIYLFILHLVHGKTVKVAVNAFQIALLSFLLTDFKKKEFLCSTVCIPFYVTMTIMILLLFYLSIYKNIKLV